MLLSFNSWLRRLSRTSARRHVFLSFKSDERDRAGQIRKLLTDEGFVVWWQEDLQCGGEWHAEIDKALLGAGCVVVLWSTASIQSSWVRHEASQAVARGTYVPVTIDAIEIRTPFDRTQAANLTHWRGQRDHPGVYSLLDRVENLIPVHLSTTDKLGYFLRNQALPLFAIALSVVGIAVLAKTYVTLDRITLDLSTLSFSLRHSLLPLDSVDVRLDLVLTDEIKGVPEYKKSLRLRIPANEDGQLKDDKSAFPAGIFPVDRSYDHGLTSVAVLPTSELWPKDAEGALLGTVVRLVDAKLFFCWRSPVKGILPPPSDCAIGQKENYDLRILLPTSAEIHRDTLWEDANRLVWTPGRNQLTLRVIRRIGRKDWEPQDPPPTVPQLEASNLAIKLSSDTRSFSLRDLHASTEGQRDKGAAMREWMRIRSDELKNARRGIEIDGLHLHYSGRSVVVSREAFKRTTSASGMHEAQVTLTGRSRTSN